LLEQNFSPSVLTPFVKIFPAIKTLVEERKFTGSACSSIVIPLSTKDEVFYLILMGIGKRDHKRKIDVEHYRRALGKLMRIMEDIKVDSIAFALPDPEFFNVTPAYLAGQTALMVEIASYSFDDYISDPNRKIMKDRRVVLLTGNMPQKDIEEGVKKGHIIGTSVNKSRHWIDLPPSVLFPTDLAGKAKLIAKDFGLKYSSFSEKEINQMGMGGLAAVSAGSDLDCALIFLEYKCGKKNAPTVAFVGKGITFDSGGLSIKPANSMETMKEDMSGAAAVIAGMASIAQLKPDINVIGVTPLAENLPSGKAAKPGDIVRFYNGKTAEIKNTDAEGRLILADALAYVVKHYKPDAIVDFATLTGSCAAALGPFYAGMMSEHEELVKKLQNSADRSGDKVWRLPLSEDYQSAIKTPVADISNIGSQAYMAGAITAALFLQNFVDDVPWAHLDIAGTAFDVPIAELPYYRSYGATGYGVRLMVDLAMTWNS
jgi:leucyl aminopeptidase